MLNYSGLLIRRKAGRK